MKAARRYKRFAARSRVCGNDAPPPATLPPCPDFEPPFPDPISPPSTAVSRDVDDATTASGVPTDGPETESLEASVDGSDAGDAEASLREALGDDYSITVHDR